MNINDIAKLANVSKGTVSRVLNGGIVAKETKARVLKVIKENNYVPSQTARSLYLKKSSKILVVLPSFSNPFYIKVIEGISSVLDENDYKILLYATHDDSENKLSFIDLIRDNTVDGAIVLENLSNDLSNENLEVLEMFPIIQCSEYTKDIGLPYVTISNFNASVDATKHLIDSGCTKLYYISSFTNFTFSKRRLDGFMSVCNEHNMQANVIETTLDTAGGLSAFDEIDLSTNDKLGVFCVSDMVAYGIMKGAIRLNIDIPNKISIVGFDDIELSQIVTPELTTISQEMLVIGNKAGEMILDYIKNPDLAPKNLVLDHKLVKRGTT